MTKRPDGFGAYITVTAAYWAFMLTDGALRMLVLLHFHSLGFHPIQLAYLFLLYEFMGIVTNLSAGWIAARFGLSKTLYGGLFLQISALMGLSQLDPTWAVGTSVIFVMAAQGLSGVAKDLTKMSSKSAVKLLSPNGKNNQLFKWVTALTGSKNAFKGFGFFVGAALLAAFDFNVVTLGMAVGLLIILLGALIFMPPGLPVGNKKAKFSQVFSKDSNINRLSAARFFLFGARDVWFVVGIPIYFHAVLTGDFNLTPRESFFIVGGGMALWIVGYGAIQAAAPRLLRAKDKPLEILVRLTCTWAGILTVIPMLLVGASIFGNNGEIWLSITLVLGLMLFGAVFALNSALHSFLILAFSNSNRVTMNVGFYYMSNAAGRLLGTLLSGLSFQFGGLTLCLVTALTMCGLSWLAATRMTNRFKLQ